LAEIEGHAITRTLEACAGSTTKAAEMLGIQRAQDQYKLQEYGAAPKRRDPG
jgi:DNA-binding protein Fis